jgi:hypothetical protein
VTGHGNPYLARVRGEIAVAAARIRTLLGERVGDRAVQSGDRFHDRPARRLPRRMQRRRQTFYFGFSGDSVEFGQELFGAAGEQVGPALGGQRLGLLGGGSDSGDGFPAGL